MEKGEPLADEARRRNLMPEEGVSWSQSHTSGLASPNQAFWARQPGWERFGPTQWGRQQLCPLGGWG